MSEDEGKVEGISGTVDANGIITLTLEGFDSYEPLPANEGETTITLDGLDPGVMYEATWMKVEGEPVLLTVRKVPWWRRLIYRWRMW